MTSNDIEACHRIGKKNNRINRIKTIIRFVNKKHAKKALFNKKKLSQNHKNYSFNTNNNPLFISENLTRMNESLAYQGRKLKRNNLVNACYTRDGIVTIKISDRSKAIKVYHMICWTSFQISILMMMNLSTMHLLMYQLSLCTELDLVAVNLLCYKYNG